MTLNPEFHKLAREIKLEEVGFSEDLTPDEIDLIKSHVKDYRTANQTVCDDGTTDFVIVLQGGSHIEVQGYNNPYNPDSSIDIDKLYQEFMKNKALPEIANDPLNEILRMMLFFSESILMSYYTSEVIDNSMQAQMCRFVLLNMISILLDNPDKATVFIHLKKRDDESFESIIGGMWIDKDA